MFVDAWLCVFVNGSRLALWVREFLEEQREGFVSVDPADPNPMRATRMHMKYSSPKQGGQGGGDATTQPSGTFTTRMGCLSAWFLNRDKLVNAMPPSE